MKIVAIVGIGGRLVPVEHNLPDGRAYAKLALYKSSGVRAILVEQDKEHRSGSFVSCDCPECRIALKKAFRRAS